MKENRWTLFKVAVYVSLACLFTISAFTAYAYVHFRVNKHGITNANVLYSSIFVLLALSSELFHFQNIMLSKFLNMDEIFTPAFKTYHTVLLIGNSISTIGWGFVLCILLSKINSPDHWQLRQKVFIGALAIGFLSNLYSIIGALRLRTYLKNKYERQQDEWIEQMTT